MKRRRVPRQRPCFPVVAGGFDRFWRAIPVFFGPNRSETGSGHPGATKTALISRPADEPVALGRSGTEKTGANSARAPWPRRTADRSSDTESDTGISAAGGNARGDINLAAR